MILFSCIITNLIIIILRTVRKVKHICDIYANNLRGGSALNLIDRIIKIVKEKGISGTRFGEIIGLSKSPLTDWKNGKSKPTLDQIIKICEYFSVSSDEILFGAKQKSCLTSEEISLLEDFEKLDEREQQIILGKISEMIYNKKMEENSEKLSTKVLWDLLADSNCKTSIVSKNKD